MRAEGRFEAAGWALSREIIAAVCEEDDLIPTPTGMGFVMLAVTFSWGLASPVIYGGRLLDGLVNALRRMPALEVDGSPYMSGPLESYEQDEEPQGFVIDR